MELNRKQILRILLIITISIIIFTVVQNIGTVFSALGFVLDILMPFIVGACIAFILNMPMRFLERKLSKIKPKKNQKLWDKLRRPLCLILSILIVLCVITVLMVLIVPEIRRTVIIIAERLPGQIDLLIASVTSWAQNIGIDQAFIESLKIDWNQIGGSLIKMFTDGGSTFLNSTISFTSSFISNIFNIVLGFVFACYVLLSKDRLKVQTKKIAYAIFPEKVTKEILRISNMASTIFSNFVVGQCTEAVTLGVLCFIGMLILSMPYAVMISSLIAVTALIPVFGAFIGTAVGMILILFQSPIQALWFLVFIIVLQQIEGNVIYPKVVGKSVGLPGIWVLCAVTIGGSIGGAIGMLLSVPLCALLYCLIREGVNLLLKKKQIDPSSYEPQE